MSGSSAIRSSPPARSPFPPGGLAAGTAVVLAVTLLSACGGGEARGTGPPATLECDPDDGGLTLPDGFCAVVVADSVGRSRHLTVAPNGDLFVAVYQGNGTEGGVVALRDTSGDGRADLRREYPSSGGTGITLRGDELYFAPDWGVIRYRRRSGSLELEGPPDTVVHGLPDEHSHRAKSAVVDGRGFLYVNVGSPSNACQQESRTPGSPGMDPCPQLDRRAGIWRFRADRTGQTQSDGTHFATGLRNTFALDVNPVNGDLYGGQHGRDQLHGLWSDLYTVEESAELPAEEIVRIREGDDFGWPYCYYDQMQEKKVLAPEYGGDGREVGRCAEAEDPVVAFPGHWAPNGLVFYPAGGHFPERYHRGAFVAWHGSWNRAPEPQEGYKVSFIPWDGAAGELSPEYVADWATGFAGGEKDPGSAEHRPAGVAVGPDGSLYVSDDGRGTIWRIWYSGPEGGGIGSGT